MRSSDRSKTKGITQIVSRGFNSIPLWKESSKSTLSSILYPLYRSAVFLSPHPFPVPRPWRAGEGEKRKVTRHGGSRGGEIALEGERSCQSLLPLRFTACHLLCARLPGSLPEGEGAAAAPLSPAVLRLHIREALYFTPSVAKPVTGPSEHEAD